MSSEQGDKLGADGRESTEGKGTNVHREPALCSSPLWAISLIFTDCGKYSHLCFIDEEIEVYRD